MPVQPNYKLLAEVDEHLEKLDRLRKGEPMEIDINKLIDEHEDKLRRLNEEIEALNPAKRCSNCGCDKWLGEYCYDCGEHFRGKP